MRTIDGHLLQVPAEADHPEQWLLQRDDGTLQELDAAAVPDDATPGAQASVTFAGEQAVRASVVAEAQTRTPGPMHAYVVAIDDSTRTDDISLAAAQASTSAMTAYWQREGGGAIESFDTAGATTLSYPGSCEASAWDVWNAAAAKFPGVAWNWSNHLLVYLPAGSGCTFGLGTLGGGYVLVGTTLLSATAHEVGHNLGLNHAWLDDGRTSREYWALYGPMALSINSYLPGKLDAGYRDQLALPDAAAHRQDLTWGSTQTVTITAQGAGTLNAVKVVDPGTGTPWYVEFRSGTGDDAGTYYASSKDAKWDGTYHGAGVHVSTWTSGGLVTHATPVVGTEVWATYRAGEWFVDDEGRVAVQVVSTTTTSATVRITTGGTGDAPRSRWSRTGKAVPALTVTPVTALAGARGRATVQIDDPSVTGGAYGALTVSLDGGTAQTLTPDATGRATWTSSRALAPGTFALAASYAGSASSWPATGSANLVVPAKSVTSVTASAADATYGTQGKVTVRVSAAQGTPSGTVTLWSGSEKVTAKTLTSAGTATLRTPASWGAGTRTLTVKYAGSAGRRASSTTTTLRVVKATPRVTVASTSTTKDAQSTVTVRVTGVGAQPGTGSVTLRIGSATVARDVQLTGSGLTRSVRIPVAKLPAGQILAVYSGNANLRPLTTKSSIVVTGAVARPADGGVPRAA
ncbi:hypothetical protein CCO02nite_06190 [Cellulomonas composti]|uniref:Bacterial Ig-like domain-containing protein n=1 Tax=Cellulomonas composti TaxID=266130 RepID=A0A511J7J1_9CELL|nr:hypothetical protein CCO02nite_06190 [Cellulomonas composti]